VQNSNGSDKFPFESGNSTLSCYSVGTPPFSAFVVILLANASLEQLANCCEVCKTDRLVVSHACPVLCCTWVFCCLVPCVLLSLLSHYWFICPTFLFVSLLYLPLYLISLCSQYCAGSLSMIPWFMLILF